MSKNNSSAPLATFVAALIEECERARSVCAQCDEVVTDDNRVVWDNDRVVCRECDDDAEEWERC